MIDVDAVDQQYPFIGSEVDRLKRIIREQDATIQRVLRERNEALGKLAVAQKTLIAIAGWHFNLNGDCVLDARTAARKALTATGTREARIVQAAEEQERAKADWLHIPDHAGDDELSMRCAYYDACDRTCAAVRGEEE